MNKKKGFCTNMNSPKNCKRCLNTGLIPCSDEKQPKNIRTKKKGFFEKAIISHYDPETDNYGEPHRFKQVREGEMKITPYPKRFINDLRKLHKDAFIEPPTEASGEAFEIFYSYMKNEFPIILNELERLLEIDKQG
jgi:hypothetical protein